MDIDFSYKQIFNQFGLLFFLLILLPLYISFEIRYHSSPDNHGFGIATAYMNKHFSYSYLVSDYLNATGLEKPIFLGQQTPILESTWHILDTQLRFASDMVLQVGRIGFPALAAVVGSTMNTVDAFSSFVLLLGIISMWAIAILTSLLVRNLISMLKSFEYSDAESFKPISGLISVKKEWVFQLIIALSPWLLIYVIEGAVTQIYLILAILLQFNLIYEYLTFQKSKIVLYVGPIFVSVVYPSGFIFYMGICALFAFILNAYLIKKFSWNILEIFTNNFQIALSLISILPLTIFLTRYTFIDIIGNFLKGAANRPYDLGPIPFYDILPITGQRLRTLDPQASVAPFSPVINSANPALFSLLFFVLLIGIVFAALIKKHKENRILFSFLLMFPLVLLFLPVRRLMSSDTSWFPYFYFRDLTLLASLGLPMIFAVTYFLFPKNSIHIKSRIVKTFAVILSILPIFVSTNNLLSDFKKASRDFDIAKKYKFAGTAKNNIYVSDRPNHAFLVMAMYDEFNLLTDGFEPELVSDIDGTYFDVVYLYNDESGEILSRKIGTFEIEKGLKLGGGVITARDLQTIKGFKAS